MISSQRMKIKVYICNQFLNSSIEEVMEEHFVFIGIDFEGMVDGQ